MLDLFANKRRRAWNLRSFAWPKRGAHNTTTVVAFHHLSVNTKAFGTSFLSSTPPSPITQLTITTSPPSWTSCMCASPLLLPHSCQSTTSATTTSSSWKQKFITSILGYPGSCIAPTSTAPFSQQQPSTPIGRNIIFGTLDHPASLATTMMRSNSQPSIPQPQRTCPFFQQGTCRFGCNCRDQPFAYTQSIDPRSALTAEEEQVKSAIILCINQY